MRLRSCFCQKLLVLLEQRRRFNTVPFRLVQLLLQGALTRLYCAEQRRIGKPLQDQQQEKKDNDGPEHQPEFNRERARSGVLFLGKGKCQRNHGTPRLESRVESLGSP